MRKGFIFLVLLAFNFLLIYGINQANVLMFNNNFMIYLNKQTPEEEQPGEDKPEPPKEETVVDTNYNGESYEKIGKKIDKYCSKTPLEGLGEFIAKNSISKGVNPYLITGIVLEGSNCKIECSIIFKECKNATGYKGEPGCFGGTYKSYNKVEDSITDIINYISKEFYTKDMQSPYKMYKTYGKNSAWALKVSNFMDAIKRIK